MPVNQYGQIIDETGKQRGDMTTENAWIYANQAGSNPTPPPVDPSEAIGKAARERANNAGKPGYDIFGNKVAASPVYTVDQLGGTATPLNVPPPPASTSGTPTATTPTNISTSNTGDEFGSMLEKYLTPPESVGSPEVALEEKKARDADRLARRRAEANIAAIQAEEQSLLDTVKTEKDNARAEIEKNAQNGGMTTASFNTAYGFKEAEINRNANTKLIGIQSRLAGARAEYERLRGNEQASQDILDNAQNALNEVWKTKTADAQNMREYRFKIFDLLLDRADKKQAIALQEKRDNESRIFTSNEAFRNDVQARMKLVDLNSAVKMAQIISELPILPTAQQYAKAQQDIAAIEAGATFKATAGTGDIANFKAFFPNVDITTPAGQKQYLDWQAKESAAGREPKAGGTGSGLNTGTFEYGTPEYTLSAIESSKQYGDKRLLQDERKNITSAKRAVGSLELYNQALNGTLDKKVSQEVFGEGTGVIKGRLRTLAGIWGGDPNAAAVNAIIQGIIPTIARGIFQEVGVLTDADIANYKKVVPDINKPENANKLIELVLLKTLERTYADTLLTAAQNQTNVSNFKDEYKSVLSRIDKLTGGASGGDADFTPSAGSLEDEYANWQKEKGIAPIATTTTPVKEKKKLIRPSFEGYNPFNFFKF